MKPLVVLNVVGMTPALLAHMPHLSGMAARGWQAELGTVLPAVTCTVQSTFLTGTMPSEHGIVGNGWYFRDLGEVMFWRQHNGLVAGEKVWDTARRSRPDHTTANLCWWYAMGASTDITVTPRPVYHADGRKSPDCYTRPPELHGRLTERHGPFPLFHYWGPTASIVSSRWIVKAAHDVLDDYRPSLLLVYVPHLDYDLQRFGPDSPQAIAAAADVDTAVAGLVARAESGEIDIVALSEYGISGVRRPVDINRALRAEGLLAVSTQYGMEYLDAPASRAFAVADHQVAHVYVPDPADRAKVRSLLEALDGVDEVLDSDDQLRYGLAHERSGELLAIATPDSWFTYYYWLDDSRAPDFARGVDIHRKPGYDPAELFFNPADPLVKGKAALILARKKVGLRYAMNVVPLDPTCVRGSHGRLPDTAAEGPVILSSSARVPAAAAGGRVAATDVRQILLDLQGLS